MEGEAPLVGQGERAGADRERVIEEPGPTTLPLARRPR
jgi:hypothetical protein